MDGVRVTKPVRAADDIKCPHNVTSSTYLLRRPNAHNYAQYALILETGLRTGEVIGLTWDAIDWKKRTLRSIRRWSFRHEQGEWRAGPPKTQQSYRTIPLTRTGPMNSERNQGKRPWTKGVGSATANAGIHGSAHGSPSLSCVILFLSTGEQENRQRTVPMIPTFTSYATKQGSKLLYARSATYLRYKSD